MLPSFLATTPDYTRITGIVAYAAAALACGLAAGKAARRGGARRAVFWLSVGLLQAALAAEVPLGFRFRLTEDFRVLFRRYGWMRDKYPVQQLVLAALAVVALGTLLLGLRAARGPGRRLAWLGIVIAVAAWLAEVVSYHYLAPILYLRTGPVVLICLAWCLAAGLVIAGAAREVRSGPVTDG